MVLISPTKTIAKMHTVKKYFLCVCVREPFTAPCTLRKYICYEKNYRYFPEISRLEIPDACREVIALQGRNEASFYM